MDSPDRVRLFPGSETWMSRHVVGGGVLVAVVTMLAFMVAGVAVGRSSNWASAGMFYGVFNGVGFYFRARPLPRRYEIRLVAGIGAVVWVVTLVLGFDLFTGGLIVASAATMVVYLNRQGHKLQRRRAHRLSVIESNERVLD